MKCPSCSSDIASYKAWLAAPLFTIRCRQCNAKLKVIKKGVYKYSSYIIAIPVAIIGAFWANGLLNNLTIAIAVVTIALLVDFLVDRRVIDLLVYTNKPQQVAQPDREHVAQGGQGNRIINSETAHGCDTRHLTRLGVVCRSYCASGLFRISAN